MLSVNSLGISGWGDCYKLCISKEPPWGISELEKDVAVFLEAELEREDKGKHKNRVLLETVLWLRVLL